MQQRPRGHPASTDGRGRFRVHVWSAFYQMLPAFGLLWKMMPPMASRNGRSSAQAGLPDASQPEDERSAPGQALVESTLTDDDACADRVSHLASERRAILETIGDGIALVAPDQHITVVNRRFLDLFSEATTPDHQAEVFVGKTFAELRPLLERITDDPSAVFAMIEESAHHPERVVEASFVQRWPAHRELAVTSTPVLLPDGTFDGRVYVLRDLTRERLASTAVAMVAHELTTPLTSIKGYLALMLDGSMGDFADEQRDALGIVKRNADRLESLIDMVRDSTRLASGRLTLERSRVDVGEVVAAVAASLRPQIEARQQRLMLDCARALVEGDRQRLTQVITHLLTSAILYTPVGGEISVGVAGDDHDVRITVVDSGIGLTAEDQAQLFQPFSRARHLLAGDERAAGLGVWITRALIEQHGGQIEVTSAPGQGSTCRVTLPALVEQVPSSAPADVQGRGEHILIVDDEPYIAQLIQRYLERGGYRVSVASNARDGLRLAQREQPRLITLDIMLPDIDGLAMLRELKRNRHTAMIPVILLSVLQGDETGKEAGAFDGLTKPVQERLLLERVAHALAQNDGAHA